VKPVPSKLRTTLRNTKSHRDDDEAFLDEELGDEWTVKDGFPNINGSVPMSHNSSHLGDNNHVNTNKSSNHFKKKSHTLGMHIVYQTKPTPSHSDYVLMEPDQNPFVSGIRTKRHADRTKRDAPYVIYPEILVIVDYDGYRLHGGDNLQVKRYFVSFWNGVDLRYKVLKRPRVRVSIAGIIISRVSCLNSRIRKHFFRGILWFLEGIRMIFSSCFRGEMQHHTWKEIV